MNITVVIVDDEDLVRAGIRLVLEAAGDIEVAGEAADGSVGVRIVRQVRPDIVLLDVHMPAMNGLEAARRILDDRTSKTRVIMLTTFDRDEYVYTAMKTGASGFLLKSAPPEELTRSIRLIAAGDTQLAPAVTRRLVEDFVRRPPPGQALPNTFDRLTQREVDVLKLIAQGLSNSEIASKLYLSEATVKTHINRILTKLQLRDRVQAVVLAYESGLVRPGE
jgi:DNA-binding NarL/FixJ family response regulator